MMAAGERQALLPSAGELAGAAIHVGLDAGERLHFAGALCGALAVEAVDARIEIHVLGDGEVFVQAELLRHVAHVAADFRSIFADVHAEDAAGAFGGRQQSAKRLDDGGLARTVGAEEAEKFSFADLRS